AVAGGARPHRCAVDERLAQHLRARAPLARRDARVGRPRPGRRQRGPRLVRADRRRRDEPPPHEVRYPHEPPLERAEQPLAVERLDNRPAAHARTVARMPPQPRTSRPGARRTSPAIAGPTRPAPTPSARSIVAARAARSTRSPSKLFHPPPSVTTDPAANRGARAASASAHSSLTWYGAPKSQTARPAAVARRHAASTRAY